jgi:hypothetical protein
LDGWLVVEATWFQAPCSRDVVPPYFSIILYDGVGCGAPPQRATFTHIQNRATTNHQSPITNHQPPTTNHHQSPTTNHQSPVTNHQPPITNHQSPITNHQSPITNHQSTK